MVGLNKKIEIYNKSICLHKNIIFTVVFPVAQRKIIIPNNALSC